MKKEKLLQEKITNTLENNYMPYAMSVIISRAIPEIDGFKPSHRKLLYTMYKMGLLTGNRTKSANIVGQTMKLNPHGDIPIYETLVRLTKGNNSLLHPLIDSKGNFGKQYSRDMAYAASRYTEAKLDKICNELFKDIDKNTVDYIDNYDNTLKEPVLFPTSFPNILINPNQGIAVGMASNICSFNLEEVCQTTIAYLKDENTDIMETLKAPDFSSGGEIIYDKKEIKEIYETGRGGFKLRARYKYDKANNCIEIYEIPYTTTVELIIDKIIELIKAGKIREITDVRDETDLNGLQITLDLKRNIDVEMLMNKLYMSTTLEDTFSCNFNILINKNPKTLGIKEIIKEWVIFRINCIKRQISFDIEKKSQKLHLLLGLEKILLDIDKAIKIIRNTEEDALVIPNLITGFAIDELQAEFIAEIKLRNLNKHYIINRIEEIKDLKTAIQELKNTIEDEDKIKKIISKELKEIIKKYGQDRKTQIISTKKVEEITEEQFIEDYNLKIFISKHNYLKKISLASLRGNAEQKLKEEDTIMQEIETNNKAELLLFSNKNIVYKLKIHDIKDCKASEFGKYLPNILELAEGENIIYITATEEYDGTMLFIFENGKAARIDMQSYYTKTNRKRLLNAYSDTAKLIYITHIKPDQELELVAFNNINRILVFNTENINTKTSRNSQGVQVHSPTKSSKTTQVKKTEDLSFQNIDYYKTKNIPAKGRYLKPEDKEENQISLI